VISRIVEWYWRVWPAHWKRNCLFQESCSRYVYRTAMESGDRAAFRALVQRIQACRPGYSMIVRDGVAELHLADGSTITDSEIALGLLSLAAPVADESQLSAKLSHS
jgi:putative component of membrane protein insertase Oxa1/YidC/SpoIIIJ protein YidD